jgi:hypothetical protein
MVRYVSRKGSHEILLHHINEWLILGFGDQAAAWGRDLGFRGMAVPTWRAAGLGAYCAVMPPSITSSEPVTHDDSSDARNSTPLAISHAVPSRPIGVRSSST